MGTLTYSTTLSCKRSFVDVARHVATCHPDLDGGEL